MARDALEALGYEVAKVTLVKGPGQLEGCAVTVVASPQQAFLPQEVAQLVNLVTTGGRLILMIDPFVENGLDPVLDLFGIVNDRHLAIDETSHYWTDAATPAVSAYPRHKMTRNLALTFFPGAVTLSPRPGGVPNDVRVTPLIETSPDGEIDVPESADERLRGRRTRTLVVHALKTLADETRAGIIVFGDGDFATNSFFPILGNGQLFLNAVSYMAEQEELIDIQPRNYALPRIELTNTQMTFTFLASSVFLPALVLLIGLVVWWRR